MLASGELAGQRYEFIDGELIDKMGQNPPHGWVVAIVNARFCRKFDPDWVRCQLPMEASGKDRDVSLPEPDLVVLRDHSSVHYFEQFPRGDESLLVVEVADTSLKFDCTEKRDIYARANVPEYWVLDLNGRRLIRHLDPRGGAYQEITVLAGADTLELSSRPDIQFAVSELLPPQ